MSGKRERTDIDPDYEDVTAQDCKRLCIIQDDAKEATRKKIVRIIDREFKEEIQSKQNEVCLINERLHDARSTIDRLRACIVANYYSSVGQSTQNPSTSQECGLHPAVAKYAESYQPTPPVKTEYEPAVTMGDYSVSTTRLDNRKGEYSASGIAETVPIPRIKTRVTRQKVVIGNVSKYIPVNQREGTDQATHKWMLYIRGPRDVPRIDHVIHKVIVFLHPSYRPNDIVEISETPFHLTRRGWGEFPVRVQLQLKGERSKKVDVIHHLKLDKTYTGLQTLGAETVIEVDMDETENDPPTNFLDTSTNNQPISDLDISEHLTIQHDVSSDEKRVKISNSSSEVEIKSHTKKLTTNKCNSHQKISEESKNLKTGIEKRGSESGKCSELIKKIKIEPIDFDEADVVSDNVKQNCEVHGDNNYSSKSCPKQNFDTNIDLSIVKTEIGDGCEMRTKQNCENVITNIERNSAEMCRTKDVDNNNHHRKCVNLKQNRMQFTKVKEREKCVMDNMKNASVFQSNNQINNSINLEKQTENEDCINIDNNEISVIKSNILLPNNQTSDLILPKSNFVHATHTNNHGNTSTNLCTENSHSNQSIPNFDINSTSETTQIPTKPSAYIKCVDQTGKVIFLPQEKIKMEDVKILPISLSNTTVNGLNSANVLSNTNLGLSSIKNSQSKQNILRLSKVTECQTNKQLTGIIDTPASVKRAEFVNPRFQNQSSLNASIPNTSTSISVCNLPESQDFKSKILLNNPHKIESQTMKNFQITKVSSITKTSACNSFSTMPQQIVCNNSLNNHLKTIAFSKTTNNIEQNQAQYNVQQTMYGNINNEKWTNNIPELTTKTDNVTSAVNSDINSNPKLVSLLGNQMKPTPKSTLGPRCVKLLPLNKLTSGNGMRSNSPNCNVSFKLIKSDLSHHNLNIPNHRETVTIPNASKLPNTNVNFNSANETLSATNSTPHLSRTNVSVNSTKPIIKCSTTASNSNILLQNSTVQNDLLTPHQHNLFTTRNFDAINQNPYLIPKGLNVLSQSNFPSTDTLLQIQQQNSIETNILPNSNQQKLIGLNNFSVPQPPISHSYSNKNHNKQIFPSPSLTRPTFTPATLNHNIPCQVNPQLTCATSTANSGLILKSIKVVPQTNSTTLNQEINCNFGVNRPTQTTFIQPSIKIQPKFNSPKANPPSNFVRKFKSQSNENRKSVFGFAYKKVFHTSKSILGIKKRAAAVSAVPPVFIDPPIRVCHKSNITELMRAIIPHFPLVSPTIDRHVHPYCAHTLDQWTGWTLGKRCASEWLRALSVRRCAVRLINQQDPCHITAEHVWTTKQTMMWCRQHAFSPHYIELLKHSNTPTDNLHNSTNENTEPQTSNNDETTLQSTLHTSTNENTRPHFPTNENLSSYTSSTEFLEKLSETHPEVISDGEDVEINVDTLDDELAIRKSAPTQKINVKCATMVPTDEARYVQDVTRKVGIKFKPIEVEESDTAPLLEEVLYSLGGRFMEDILRSTFSQIYTRKQCREEITPVDLFNGIRSLPHADFLTNTHLGVIATNTMATGSIATNTTRNFANNFKTTRPLSTNSVATRTLPTNSSVNRNTSTNFSSKIFTTELVKPNLIATDTMTDKSSISTDLASRKIVNNSLVTNSLATNTMATNTIATNTMSTNCVESNSIGTNKSSNS